MHILETIRENPDIVNIGRRELNLEFYSRFNRVRDKLEVPLLDGSSHSTDIVDVGLMLSALLSERPYLQDLFLEALARCPCSRDRPWGAIVGYDEFTPGDKLKVNNRRKTMVLSISFAELGPANLSLDAVWITPFILRHTVIQEVVGGWSNVLRLILTRIFMGVHGIQTVGIPITIGDRVVVIHAKLKWLFSDGDGLRSGLDWKGAAGMKPCFRHWNVLSKSSDLLRGDEDDYVDITCHDCSRFRCWTSGELYSTIDLLNAARIRVDGGTMAKARLENLEKSCGFNQNKHGLLSDLNLRAQVDIFSTCLYDWMHSALQNGVITEEVFLYTQACSSAGHTPASLEKFIRDDWTFPMSTRAKGQGLYHIFDKFRSKASDKADRLKASASEMLGVYGLIRHWSATIVGHVDRISPQRQSFDAGCAVVDLILQAKRVVVSANDASGALVRLMSTHLRLHKAAYGVDHIKPKHHWLLDFAQQLGEVGCVIDAFIIERLHLRVKRQEHLVKELRVFEVSVLAGIVNIQFDEAAKPLSSGLRGSPYTYQGVDVADHIVVGSLRLSVGDVVLRGAQAGVIKLCVEDEAVLMTIVEELTMVEQVASFNVPLNMFRFDTLSKHIIYLYSIISA
jgi:hypothetical protein